MEFKLLLRRASFNAEDEGVVLPEELTVVTDVDGKAIVDLWPLKSAYRILISEEYEEVCGKLNWSFYVPITDEIIEAQTLFLVPPPNNLPWDEEAMGKITQAVQDTQDNADSAAGSAQSAAMSATSANSSKIAAAGSASSAANSAAASLSSQQAAANSAANAASKASESASSAAAALASQNAAAASAASAAVSATEAKAEKVAAAASAVSSANSATTSEASKVASGNSATAAALSAAEAKAEKVAAANSATAAAGSASTATTQAGIATTQAGVAKTEADRARAAADEASSKQPLNGNLTAFSNLSAAANRLPYFTGTNSMGLAGFTSQGINLVGQGSYSDMRNLLGLGNVATYTVAANLNDRTVDRVTTVGYAGIGRQLSTRTLPNTPTNRADVLKRGIGFSVDMISTGDKPANVVDGPMLSMDLDASQGINLLFDWRTGAMYTYNDTTAASVKKWRKQYNEDNVLDSMDNGGIIERGSNTNGEYTKYKDGTMTSFTNAISMVVPTANVNTTVNWTFPIAFSASPVVVPVIRGPNANDTFTINRFTGTATSAAVGSVIMNASVAQTYFLGMMAHGRWK